jgi:hypothetical protein
VNKSKLIGKVEGEDSSGFITVVTFAKESFFNFQFDPRTPEGVDLI